VVQSDHALFDSSRPGRWYRSARFVITGGTSPICRVTIHLANLFHFTASLGCSFPPTGIVGSEFRFELISASKKREYATRSHMIDTSVESHGADRVVREVSTKSLVIQLVARLPGVAGRRVHN